PTHQPGRHTTRANGTRRLRRRGSPVVRPIARERASSGGARGRSGGRPWDSLASNWWTLESSPSGHAGYSGGQSGRQGLKGTSAGRRPTRSFPRSPEVGGSLRTPRPDTRGRAAERSTGRGENQVRPLMARAPFKTSP